MHEDDNKDLFPKMIDLKRASDLSKLEEIQHKDILSFKDREFLRDFTSQEKFKDAMRSMPDPLGPWRW